MARMGSNRYVKEKGAAVLMDGYAHGRWAHHEDSDMWGIANMVRGEPGWEFARFVCGDGDQSWWLFLGPSTPWPPCSVIGCESLAEPGNWKSAMPGLVAHVCYLHEPVARLPGMNWPVGWDLDRLVAQRLGKSPGLETLRERMAQTWEAVGR